MINRSVAPVFLLGALVTTAADYPLRDAVECRPRDGLPNVLTKLERGQPVRIAYLGGSITAQPGWRPKTLKWFQEQFPQSAVSEINAAIGGTGSDLGVFRLKQDVLDHQPDLLFVEFAVNDGGADPHRIHQAMEGIVRQTLRANPRTDICFVYTLVAGWTETLRDGKFPRAASAMEAIAEHYGIPSIHLGLQVAILEGEGRLVFTGPQPKTDEETQALGDKTLFSPDGVHPYPETGHELYLQAVVRGMSRIREAGEPGPHVLPEPFAKDNWEAAQMVPLNRATLSGGWQKLDPQDHDLAKRFQNRMPELWGARRPGETIRLRFRGTTLRLYDLLGPDCGQVIVRVDDQPPVIRPRFDAYCTYHRLATLSVAEGLPAGIHTVALEIHPDQPDKAAILTQRNQTIDNPARYDGTAWYAGSILVLGEVLPAAARTGEFSEQQDLGR
ncbi:MAG: SGNH/GDSL hydrolase family protein [Verrucomicrobiales bacterium]|nr:SGNH/GDSL hydrolase family protein [Verrucomicrobiales bacterium]